MAVSHSNRKEKSLNESHNPEGLMAPIDHERVPVVVLRDENANRRI